VELRYPADAEAFREEVLAFLRANLPAGWAGMGALTNEEAEHFSISWRRTLFEHGLLGITWPTAYGGRGRSKVDQVVLAEELAQARVPLPYPRSRIDNSPT
jgi:hypothetical protein